jgi:hypothetical protein
MLSSPTATVVQWALTCQDLAKLADDQTAMMSSAVAAPASATPV